MYEEEAEEYVDTLLNKDDSELDKFLDENLGDLKLTKKQAGTLLGIIKGIGISSFLAGLKAGKGMNIATKWHDLRKDPNDLPEPNIAVLICFQFEKWTTTYIAYYRPTIKKWQMYNMHEAQRQPVVDDYIDRDEVIAWCEIPKYTEE